MPWPVVGQLLAAPADDLAESPLLQRATDAVAIEVLPVHLGRRQPPTRRAPQVFVMGALHHPEERLVWTMRPLPGEFSVRRQAALRPSLRPCDGRLLVLPSVEQGRQLIEREGDIGAQLVLDAHTHLWRETMPVTVDRGSEPDTIVIHVGLTLFARR